MCKHRILAIVTIALFGVYVTSYLALSRRGYAEMDNHNGVGFYYFPPEDSDSWRRKNYACVHLFSPQNAIDRFLGLGRAPASEPLWRLS